MTEHECRHEVDLALLQENTKEIRLGVDKLVKIIDGNGESGLVTKMALARQSIHRVWGTLGVCLTIVLAILGICYGMK